MTRVPTTAHAQYIDRPAPHPAFSDLYMTSHAPGFWRLQQPFVYALPPALATALGGPVVYVPADFVTDLDSVPRLPVAYWLTKGRATLAAVVHDWLYVAGRLTPDPASPTVTREQADAVLMAAMVDEGVGPIWRRIIHGFVRLGGGSGWAVSRQLQRETEWP